MQESDSMLLKSMPRNQIHLSKVLSFVILLQDNQLHRVNIENECHRTHQNKQVCRICYDHKFNLNAFGTSDHIFNIHYALLIILFITLTNI